MLDTNFWQDKSASTKILKEKKLFENLINSYETSLNKLNDLDDLNKLAIDCLLYTSPSPRDRTRSRMPSSA